MSKIALYLFRRDLRLHDNPALAAACANHEQVLPVFTHAEVDGVWAGGAASRWWLHHSLQELQTRLRDQHGSLYLANSDSVATLLDLLRRSGARAVYWNRRYEPAAMAHDTEVKRVLREQGFEVHSFAANLWAEPWTICTQQGDPYRAFTPYWRNLRSHLTVTVPLPAPAAGQWLTLAGSVTLDDLQLLPRITWDAGLADTWQPGERGAHEMLDVFCDDALGDYAHGRDLPGRHGTSRLSAHLHFGEISPHQIHAELQARARNVDAKRRPDIEPYLRQLGWREFAHHLLYHFPQTPTENFNQRFANFRWAPTDEAVLERWRHGRTGIPLVDAGMRELWHTGWMHNRVRMIVASFLTKNLRQHWHHGARWFWDTLVDADLANNTLGWQWVAGCGADAAPYFRVFNPVTQARKFDLDGVYLRRWLPELADAPLPLLHEPWKAPALLRCSAYPSPMVDLVASRTTALDVYKASRG